MEPKLDKMLFEKSICDHDEITAEVEKMIVSCDPFFKWCTDQNEKIHLRNFNILSLDKIKTLNYEFMSNEILKAFPDAYLIEKISLKTIFYVIWYLNPTINKLPQGNSPLRTNEILRNKIKSREGYIRCFIWLNSQKIELILNGTEKPVKKFQIYDPKKINEIRNKIMIDRLILKRKTEFIFTPVLYSMISEIIEILLNITSSNTEKEIKTLMEFLGKNIDLDPIENIVTSFFCEAGCDQIVFNFQIHLIAIFLLIRYDVKHENFKNICLALITLKEILCWKMKDFCKLAAISPEERIINALAFNKKSDQPTSQAGILIKLPPKKVTRKRSQNPTVAHKQSHSEFEPTRAFLDDSAAKEITKNRLQAKEQNEYILEKMQNPPLLMQKSQRALNIYQKPENTNTNTWQQIILTINQMINQNPKNCNFTKKELNSLDVYCTELSDLCKNNAIKSLSAEKNINFLMNRIKKLKERKKLLKAFLIEYISPILDEIESEISAE